MLGIIRSYLSGKLYLWKLENCITDPVIQVMRKTDTQTNELC